MPFGVPILLAVNAAKEAGRVGAGYAIPKCNRIIHGQPAGIKSSVCRTILTRNAQRNTGSGGGEWETHVVEQ